MKRTVRRCRTAGRRVSRARSSTAAAARSEQRPTGRRRRRAQYGSPAGSRSVCAGQPRGDLVLMPIPLSSHTNRTGHGDAAVRRYAAAFSAPGAVEWLADASPKLHTHDGVARARGRRTPGRAGQAERERQAHRPRQVGGDRRGLRDDVQRRGGRTPCAGHRRSGRSAAEVRLSRTSRTGSVGAGDAARRGRRRSRRSGSAAALGRRRATAARRAALLSWPAEPIV